MASKSKRAKKPARKKTPALVNEAKDPIAKCRAAVEAVMEFKSKMDPAGTYEDSASHKAIQEVRLALQSIPRDL